MRSWRREYWPTRTVGRTPWCGFSAASATAVVTRWRGIRRLSCHPWDRLYDAGELADGEFAAGSIGQTLDDRGNRRVVDHERSADGVYRLSHPPEKHVELLLRKAVDAAGGRGLLEPGVASDR